MSRSRTCLMAQQRGLEPPIPSWGTPAFQTGRLPVIALLHMAAADGIEPPYSGSEPDALPLSYAAVWAQAKHLLPRLGKRREKRGGEISPHDAAGDRSGRRTHKPPFGGYRFSGPAGIAACHPCHGGTRWPASALCGTNTEAAAPT